jgi:hypothetical protein
MYICGAPYADFDADYRLQYFRIWAESGHEHESDRTYQR